MFLQRRLRAVHAFPRVRRFRVHVRVIQRAATTLASPKATPVASAAAPTALVVSVRNNHVADRIRWIFLLSMCCISPILLELEIYLFVFMMSSNTHDVYG